MNTNKLLKDLGLNTTSITIYMHLLSEKRSTILQLARATGISRTSVYAGVEVLKQWGLVGDAIEGNKKYIYAESPTNLINAVHIKETIASKAAEALLPIFETGKNIDFTLKYYGKEGLKIIGNEMLNSKEKKIFQFANKEIMDNHFKSKYLEEFQQKRFIKKIDMKVLLTYNDFISLDKNKFSSKNNYKQNRDIRILPKKIDVFSYLLSFDDYVVLFGKPEEELIIKIKNKSFAKTFKSIFLYFWSISESY